MPSLKEVRNKITSVGSTMQITSAMKMVSAAKLKRAQDAIDNVAIEKQRVMQQLREEYAQLKASWGGFAGYDRFIANANNASLGALAAYDDLVPQFEAVFEKQARSWPAFFAAIQGITSLAPKERRQALQDMTK